jgi:hypothetical protein
MFPLRLLIITHAGKHTSSPEMRSEHGGLVGDRGLLFTSMSEPDTNKLKLPLSEDHLIHKSHTEILYLALRPCLYFLPTHNNMA